MGIFQAIEYIMETVYHHFVVSSKGSTKGWGNQANQGVESQEMWQAAMGTSEVPSRETDGVQEGGHEETED